MKSFLAIDWHPGQPVPQGEAPSHVSIGVFDGLHWGHRNILGKLRTLCGEHHKSVAITFRQSPKRLRNPQGYPGDILTTEQKISTLRSLGVDLVLLIDFSQDFSRMEAKDFLNLLQNSLNLHSLVVGHDFSMGHRSSTKAGYLRELLPDSVYLSIMPPVYSHDSVISSTRIRQLVLAGKFDLVKSLLGRPWTWIHPKAGESKDQNQVIPEEGIFLALRGMEKCQIEFQSHRIVNSSLSLRPGDEIRFLKRLEKE